MATLCHAPIMHIADICVQHKIKRNAINKTDTNKIDTG